MKESVCKTKSVSKKSGDVSCAKKCCGKKCGTKSPSSAESKNKAKSTEVVRQKASFASVVSETGKAVAEASNMFSFDEEALSIITIARTGSLFDYEKVQ